MKRLLVIGLAVALLLAAGPAHAATLLATENTSKPTSAGDTTRNVNIYKVTVDPIQGTCFAELLDTRQETVVPNFTDNFNGNAFDPLACRFYYSRYDRDPSDLVGNDPNRFFFYEPANAAGGSTTESTLPLDLGSAGGAIFNGDYYYIPQRSAELRRVILNASGEKDSEVKVCDIPLGGGSLAFGDITFDPGSPNIFGSATRLPGGPRFFRIDNLDCSTYTEISAGDPFGAGALQIAFGLSDGILYGHSARDGRFFTIDTSNGNQTLLCNALNKNVSSQVTPTGDFGGIDVNILKFSDLTEGECEERVFDGCTPGYWKQKHHFDSWSGYDPKDDFEAVFGVNASFTTTLGKALRLRGGGEKALARHAVAALLNASNPDVNYPYSEAVVIQIVQDAYATGNFEGAKDDFEAQNEQTCPLN